MEKFICIHGHFYQPPRENPWLETVEVQDSATPYHDWNERITVECYAPNATARILDEQQRINRILSNYSKISFNFGPTLLAWMKDKMPDVHDAIIASDKESQKNFAGHGSAIAQVYNHMILPLANQRDKRTQVLWGLRDFESRFGRKSEGIWLPETAVDTDTLEVLADFDIKYTILSPFQASKVRKIGEDTWNDVNGGRVDPKRPYLVRLPSGRSIAVFFYDGPVSQAVAFEKLLESGEKFSGRLLGAFGDGGDEDQLVHIATDGESYGHHHRYGEMALAFALRVIEKNNGARLTNYGQYLQTHPPKYEAEIHERSAWSCSHGVGRWMENCGCNSGGHGGWHQMWRGPLRDVLNWLRDTAAPLYEKHAAQYVKDPWEARDNYISVILDRAPENINAFFQQHACRDLSEADQITAIKLLELQRHAMLMFTSCGWFFDELSGIETVQVIQYAGRVVQLAKELFDQDLETVFLEHLEKAKSNIAEHCDGRCIYNKFVKPAAIDPQKAVAHYAVSSLFQDYTEKTKIFSYTFQDEHRKVFTAGRTKLAVGRTKARFDVTGESNVFCYAVMHMGEHNLTGGACKFQDEAAFQAMENQLQAAFDQADFPETIRLMDRHFGQTSYSLKSLFKDEQRRILNQILQSTREDLENRYRLITERYTPLMKFLGDSSVWLLPALQTATSFVLRLDVHRLFASEEVDVNRLNDLLQEAHQAGIGVVDAELSFIIKNKMELMMRKIANEPTDLRTIRNLEEVAKIVMPLPLGLNLWKVQNTYWEMMQAVLPQFRDVAVKEDGAALEWFDAFLALGEQLGFNVDKYRI